jgi:glycosyltransferase involved in cell wall biosynthesis
MKFWLPYTRGGSGADVSIEFLAQGLRQAGHAATAQPFPHHFQYAPWLLRLAKPPAGTDVIISNSWNGFAFHRPKLVNITVERLFVLDSAYRPHKSRAQALFHDTLVRHFVRRSMATADRCVAVSAYTAHAVARQLNVAEPETILNAVDTAYFCPARNDTRQEDRSSRPFHMLFVGNFTRRKGADLIIQIMQRLGAAFELAFTSGRRASAHDDLPANMHCLGKLSLEQVRDAYRQADALLFPSRLEGLPRTVMESLACGTPVIAADTSSLPEAVDHLHTGLLCPLDDTDTFVAAARRLADDKALWSGMVKAARETAIERFSLDRMVKEYADLATRLLAEKGDAKTETVKATG